MTTSAGPSVYSSAGRLAARRAGSRLTKAALPTLSVSERANWTLGALRPGRQAASSESHRETDRQTRAGDRRPPRYPRCPLGTDRVTRGDFGSLRLAAGPELTGGRALGQLGREAARTDAGQVGEKGRCPAGGQSADGRTGIVPAGQTDPGTKKPVAVVGRADGRGTRKPEPC